MRTNNLKCSITLRVPYNKPDGNRVIHTREAIEKMVDSLSGGYPIKVASGLGKTQDVDNIIGVTTEPYSAIWDEDEGVCILAINGIIFHGGIECFVNELTNGGAVNDCTVAGFGLSID